MRTGPPSSAKAYRSTPKVRAESGNNACNARCSPVDVPAEVGDSYQGEGMHIDVANHLRTKNM